LSVTGGEKRKEENEAPRDISLVCINPTNMSSCPSIM
jgi:hypothetical protein